MTAKRIEFTVSEEFSDRIDGARGHESRASWIKRALELALDVEPLSPVTSRALREAWESPAVEEQLKPAVVEKKSRQAPSLRETWGR